MKNPFVYGEYVTGDNFCDREEEKEKLKKDLMNCQKVFVISARRIGKTSLIMNVLEELKDKVISIFLDLESFSSYKEFLNTYLSLLIEKSTTIDRILNFIRELALDLRIDFKLNAVGRPTISLAYEKINQEIDNKVFNLPEIIAKKRNKKVIVVLDEFQEILKLNKNIEGILRSNIQGHHNVGYIFCGSKKHILNEMINSPNRAFYKIGPVLYLKKISKEIFIKFIKNKFDREKIIISNNVIEKIIDLAENIPYYVQMISHELYDYCAYKKIIREEDLYFLIEKIIYQYSQNYYTEWSRLILSKRQLLKAIANYGGKHIFSKEFLSKNDLGMPSAVYRTITSLVDDGYLDKENDEYFFNDILFMEWIKKNVK